MFKRQQKITPFLWFDDKAEEAAAFIPPFLKIQRS
jgi:predicted 3-demethylubiquinone-9 3-methyltransferase (glyoxalase superfamily)